MNSVLIHQENAVIVVTINQPEVRNAVDGPTANELADAFRKFGGEERLKVAVPTGAGGRLEAVFPGRRPCGWAANRLLEPGHALDADVELATDLARFAAKLLALGSVIGL